MKNHCNCDTQTPYLLELSLADTIAVKDDTVRLEPCALVELNQHFSDHGRQLGDYLLSMGLDTHCSTVTAGVGIHTGHQLYHRRGYVNT